jgi:hypothetical protein
VKRLISLLVLFVALTVNTTYAQVIPLQVTVTFVSGRNVFLDRGREAGIKIGMRVRLYPPGSSPLEGIVRSVSSSSTLVELPEGISLPDVGTRGEIEVSPLDGVVVPPTSPMAHDRKIPAHPPWKRKRGDLSPDKPLLAPAFGERPEDRPVEVSGRLYAQFLYTADRGDNRDNDSFLGRLGTSVKATNLFGQGGRTTFAGELNNSGADLFDDDDQATNDNIRLERLSYTLGEQEYSPYRFEVGRFYSTYLPELGLLDGAESVLLLPKGFKVGMGLGLYPEPFPLDVSGDDTSVHFFVDYQSKAKHKLSTTLAYQKTWNEGNPDRDLFLGRLNMKPTESLWVYASWKIDIYTASDSIKSKTLDLTEFWAQLRYAPDSVKGASVSLSHFAFPELNRRLFRDLPFDLVRDGKVDRVNLSAWYRPVKSIRLSSRFDVWKDQNNSGTGGELSADFTDPKGIGPALHTAVYFTDGSFNDGVGLRAQGRKGVGNGSGFVGYELFRYTNVGSIGAEEELTRHTLRGGLDWSLKKWNFSLGVDHVFGDGEKSYTVSLYAQHRF